MAWLSLAIATLCRVRHSLADAGTLQVMYRVARQPQRQGFRADHDAVSNTCIRPIRELNARRRGDRPNVEQSRHRGSSLGQPSSELTITEHELAECYG